MEHLRTDLTMRRTLHRAPAPPEPNVTRRRELRHDIRHELATIGLLASLLTDAEDIGDTNRSRVKQLQLETAWLDELLQAYDREHSEPEDYWSPPVERVRVDVLAAEAVTALRLTSPARFRFEADPAVAYANRLRLWRALRNLIDNASQAVGPNGVISVRVGTEDGWTVAQIDDNGPGFPEEAIGYISTGLRVVRDFATDMGGRLELRTSQLGGGCARIVLPGVNDPGGLHRADSGAGPHL
ncbi:sensor histidine kinase [Longispora sp. K20-0274]|uniref:sensor histidine kinase n=1 Tax=Longispora sp. K20-0274 TaxID=3088255 RepID=UPI00399B6530